MKSCYVRVSISFLQIGICNSADDARFVRITFGVVGANQIDWLGVFTDFPLEARMAQATGQASDVA
jgi:hypothetical protein